MKCGRHDIRIPKKTHYKSRKTEETNIVCTTFGVVLRISYCAIHVETEWKYAARGGNKSQGYKYSGSNDLDAVA